MKRRTDDLFLAATVRCRDRIRFRSRRAPRPTSENPPPVTPATLPSAPDGASAVPTTSAERNRKREAALAELGKRLSAEQKPDADYQVLNRTGHNYGSRPPDR